MILSNIKNIFLFIFSLFFSISIFAQEPIVFQTDIGAPLKVNADKMYLDKVSFEGGLSGSVSIEQGPLNLKSDQMRFTFTSDQEMPLITNLFASQGVVLSNEDISASGNNASYSVSKNEILIEGNVIVNNSFTIMKGEKLFIDLETGKINFLSDEKQNNRIRGELLENDKITK